MPTLIRAAALLLACALLAACSSAGGGEAPTPGGGQAVPEGGAELFAANCAVCHGAGGEGQPNWHIRKPDGTLPAPPLNGDGHTWHHSDGLLYRIVSGGGKILEDPAYPSFKSAMPAFGDRLSRDEIVAVLTYIKSLWGDKVKRDVSISEWQAEISEREPFPPGN